MSKFYNIASLGLIGLSWYLAFNEFPEEQLGGNSFFSIIQGFSVLAAACFAHAFRTAKRSPSGDSHDFAVALGCVSVVLSAACLFGLFIFYADRVPEKVPMMWTRITRVFFLFCKSTTLAAIGYETANNLAELAN